MNSRGYRLYQRLKYYKMKVAFLSDFFDSEIIGGAEKNDSVLINHLKTKFELDKVHTYNLDPLIDKYDFFIVSNFIRLSPACKETLIRRGNYIIYEHDHKYVASRDPAAYVNFKAPEDQIINKVFYQSALRVFVLSSVCKKVIEDNLALTNVHNIACSLWSKENLKLISILSTETQKKYDYGILNSTNGIKGTAIALDYCRNKSIVPRPIMSPSYPDFLKQMAECEKFLFFPQVLETFSRVCAEAKMLNCDVMTNSKMIGFFSEEYSSLKGIELINKISDNVDQALLSFEEIIIL